MAKYKVLKVWGSLKVGESVELKDEAVIKKATELKVIELDKKAKETTKED